ncbi:MAG: hypothetical protein H6738_21745 [Alphaproteobacteria bacterium]|nr:hypothetical protein [Alphaproteobacteria bacterium]MCB9699421.1 hypothetical protein [Alphaproteobacteria bacterium]
MSRAYLHLLLLAHVSRFFGAARRATDRLGQDELASLTKFAGNMLWAHSGFASGDAAQRRAMAVVGGASENLAGGLTGAEGRAQEARAALDELERSMLAGMDTLVDTLGAELAQKGLSDASPATLDAWIWERLFPGTPWPSGHAELEEALLRRWR